MCRGLYINLRFIYLTAFIVLFIGQKQNYAQDKVVSSCIIVSDNSDIKSKNPSGIQLENNTQKVISLLFEFDRNGFYDQETLKVKIMQGVDTKKSKDFNRLLILDNIAGIIKSSNHRNFNLLFYATSPTVIKKKYSPLSMITSFYDKQCNDYQRLAAQMAIITPFFFWQDFKAYYILRHVVVEVKVGREYIFHDFDPGEPGFRFYRNADSLKFASFSDLMKDTTLINKEQFYTYNNVNLCPWISEPYYRSLFGNLKGQIDYTNIGDVYGFVPRWTIPPGTKIISYFPDTTSAARFGAKVSLNKNDPLISKAFAAYSKYTAHKNIKDSLKINLYLSKYLKDNFDFDFDINYFYLMKAGLLVPGDSTTNVTTFKDNYINASLETTNDTLFFQKDFFIPLPLRKVRVKKGKVSITETEIIDKIPKDYKYNVTDSLIFNLYDYSPPIVTSESVRNPPQIDASSLIYGPSKGYILPHSIVEFEYYYNPFYYAFHDLVFKMRYEKECEDKLDVKAIY